ncbi:hypothetical protein D3C71_1193300 [compost metagenome]
MQRVVFHRLPVRPVRCLLQSPALHHKTRMAAAPVAATVLQKIIGRQRRPVAIQGHQCRKIAAHPAGHIGRRQNGIARLAKLARHIGGSRERRRKSDLGHRSPSLTAGAAGLLRWRKQGGQGLHLLGTPQCCDRPSPSVVSHQSRLPWPLPLPWPRPRSWSRSCLPPWRWSSSQRRSSRPWARGGGPRRGGGSCTKYTGWLQAL